MRLTARKIKIEVGKDAKEFIMKVGYDPVYGARPIKRAIQKYIQDPLAIQILDGRVKENATVKIAFDKSGDNLKIEVK